MVTIEKLSGLFANDPRENLCEIFMSFHASLDAQNDTRFTPETEIQSSVLLLQPEEPKVPSRPGPAVLISVFRDRTVLSHVRYVVPGQLSMPKILAIKT